MQREVIIRTVDGRNATDKTMKYMVIFNQQNPVGDYSTEYKRFYSTSAAATMDAREWLTQGQPPLDDMDIEELAL